MTVRQSTAPAGRERGSVTVWAVGLIAVGTLVLTAVLGLAAAVSARHRAESAADLAALAAGGRLLLAPGVACAEAGRVAAAHGARLVSCEVSDDEDQDSVLVTVTTPSLPGFAPATARARAGPLSTPVTDRPPEALPSG